MSWVLDSALLSSVRFSEKKADGELGGLGSDPK